MYCLSVVAFTWVYYLFDLYVTLRQRRVYKTVKECPKEVSSVYSHETFEKARLYALDKMNFSIVHDLYEIVKSSMFLYCGVIAWLWYVCQDHVGSTESEVTCSILYVTYLSLFSFVEQMPWGYYSTFVLEQKHGFNKQTLGFFVKDRLKGLVLSWCLTTFITSILILIIRWGGDYFYVAAYVFTLAVCLVMMFIYPEFIAPLFDRYEPLPDIPLRQKIFDLATKIKFPLKKLLVVEGSKRSSHSNAYFYGFGSNKRIVLFDTLIKGFVFPGKEEKDVDKTKGCSDDKEIEAILAHELGHWKCSHLLYQIGLSQIYIFMMFYIFSVLINNDPIFVDFGFYPGTAPNFLKLTIIFQYIFTPVSSVYGVFQTWLTRKFEFQADAFSVNLDYGEYLKRALLVLCKDNLSFPCNDPLYSMVNFTHPPVVERMAAIDVGVATKSKKAE